MSCSSLILQVIRLKLCTYTAAILWTPSKLHPEWWLELHPEWWLELHPEWWLELRPEWWLELHPEWCGTFLLHFPPKKLFCIFLYQIYCVILLHSIHISTNFIVFPFKWYQEYAYPCFRSWATGSQIWECHFRLKLQKRGLSLFNYGSNETYK